MIDIESKKPQFKKLTKTKGWITQNFGLPQRFENNFIQWFKLVGNTFKQINQYKLPSDAGLMFLYVAELSLNSGPYTELELKYQYDDNTKKNFGFLYIIENED